MPRGNWSLYYFFLSRSIKIVFMKTKAQLFFPLLLLTLLGCNTNNEINDELKSEVEKLQIQNDSLMGVITNTKIEPEIPESPQWYFPESHSRKLLAAGIENPEAYIKNSLRENPSVIPMKAVLGGTMHFNNMELLGDKWLIADFEDGHVYGKAIFEYSIVAKDKLRFKVVAVSDN